LYGKLNQHITHYGAWNDGEKTFLKCHWGGEPEHSSNIRPTHHNEAKCAHLPDCIPK